MATAGAFSAGGANDDLAVQSFLSMALYEQGSPAAAVRLGWKPGPLSSLHSATL